MKVCVLVPSEAYRQNAGARIRYGRLMDALSAQGVVLELLEIGQFDPKVADADIVIISKCHDARAQLVAIEARRQGIRVGVDLFDDYFSQRQDARLVRFRTWLTELAPCLSFAMTSTSGMADVASAYLGHLPVLVVNDAAAFDPRGEMNVATPEEIESKHRKALDSQRLKVAWFGIGDNPFFPVGLSDIETYASELAVLARTSRMAVDLTILTNARALTAEGLARIASLPVSLEVREWSEEAEAALLQESLVCFVPVNAQPFSAAKSLNRAVTALTAGCQLLSAGFPLYQPLESFLYRDAETLAGNLLNDGLRVSASRREDLIAILNQWADANVEASRLAQFLASLPIPSAPSARVALVHGAGTSAAANQLAKVLGDVTVGSPYAPSNLDVDLWVRACLPMRVDLLMSEALARDFMARSGSLTGPVKYGRGSFMLAEEEEGPSCGQATVEISNAPLGVQLALYGAVMARIRHRLATDFDIDQIIWSEISPLPYSFAK